MPYIISAVLGYLLGSFPTAFLIMKKIRNLDITKTGTGNVGAMNAYEISNSKFIGLLIFLVDALKGLLIVYLIILFFPFHFVFPALALLFAVLGHCYSPWISFNGGRGLSTSLGGMLLISPLIPIIWGAAWVIFFIIKREIIISNFFATLLTLIIAFLNVGLLNKYSYPHPNSDSTIAFFISSILILILIKHFEPVRSLIGQNIIKKEE